MPQGEQVKNGKAFEYDHIDYAGHHYPCRTILMPDGYEYTVSVDTLNKEIYRDTLGYISSEAQQIDERLFFYLNDDDIHRPMSEIVEIINEAIA